MTLKRLFFLLIPLFVIAATIVIILRFPHLQEILIACVITPSLGVITFTTTPFKQWLEAKIKNPQIKIKGASCKIYLYGHGGTGKTTLVKSWLGGSIRSEEQTEQFTYHSGTVPLDLSKKTFINIRVSDYRGQKPSQAFQEVFKNLSTGDSDIVNAIVFLVDIIPPEDEYGNFLDSEDKQLTWLGSDTLKKINQRVNQHEVYINGTLEPLFEFTYSDKLKSVRLVINKFDVLEELLRRNHISLASNPTAETYIMALFQNIEDEIRQACAKNRIADFSISVISAKNDRGTRGVLRGILETYSRRN